MDITAEILESAGFTNEQTPNKCTCHIKNDFRILLFEDGKADLQKKYKMDWPKVASLQSLDHLKTLWFGLTGELLKFAVVCE